QFIHRVWRISSTADVFIYQFILQNSIDALLLTDFGDKLDSAQLGLDGCLIEQHVQEVDLAQLLAKAVRNFDPAATTISERDIEREWHPTLRDRLADSEARFRARRGSTRMAQNSTQQPSPLAQALAAKKEAKATHVR